MAVLNPGSSTIATRRIWQAGLLASLLAIVANGIIRTITAVLFDVSAEFRPFTWPQLVLFTLLGTLGATAVFALVARRAARPVPTFRRIALVVLVASFVPDLAMLATNAVPGASPAAVVALLLMHVVTAVLAVRLLTVWAVGGCGHLPKLLAG